MTRPQNYATLSRPESGLAETRIQNQRLRDGNTRTANFYPFWNEVPTILLLIIVAMAVAKPF
jgi:uncharacterized membrane protein